MTPRHRSLPLAAALLVACGGTQLGYRTQDTMGPGIRLVRPAPSSSSSGASTSSASRSLPSGAAAPATSSAIRSEAPLADPRPSRQALFYRYEMLHDRGRVRVASVKAVRFSRAVVTPRFMGRYAIELWIGAELLERVRFDFPLTGADFMDAPPAPNGRRRLGDPPRFAPGLQSSRQILVPALDRATEAFIVDRATGERRRLPWPPEAPLPAFVEAAPVPSPVAPEPSTGRPPAAPKGSPDQPSKAVNGSSSPASPARAEPLSAPSTSE